MKTKELFNNGSFVLTRHSKPRNKGQYYTVRANFWQWRGEKTVDTIAVRTHFDPHSNRGSAAGSTWKFKSKQMAEQLILLALIKWPQR